MRAYESKLDLINSEAGLILVEQPHGLVAYDHGERKAKKMVVDGQGVHDLLMLDAMTLTMLKQIVNALSEKNREQYLSWSWCSIGEQGWELAGKCRQESAA